jgi:hypothetical protein
VEEAKWAVPDPRHEDANGSGFADGELQNRRYDSEMRLANPRHSRFTADFNGCAIK